MTTPDEASGLCGLATIESPLMVLRLLLLLPALVSPPTGSLTVTLAAAMAACKDVVVPRSTTSPMGLLRFVWFMLATLELEQLVRMLQLELPARWPLELPLMLPLLLLLLPPLLLLSEPLEFGDDLYLW